MLTVDPVVSIIPDANIWLCCYHIWKRLHMSDCLHFKACNQEAVGMMHMLMQVRIPEPDVPLQKVASPSHG